MRKFAGVSCGVVALMMTLSLLFAAPAFASGGELKLEKSTPEQGNTRVPIENVGVKLFFNGDVTSEDVWASNAACFALKDAEGKTVHTTAYRGEKAGEQGYILVMADPAGAKEGQTAPLKEKSAYSLSISGELAATSGAKLGEDVTIGFQTMDVGANSRLSMILMVVMMVAVIALMFVRNWSKMKAEAEAAALLKANPYKIAKERSISVDEAKVLIEKAREKNQKQLEKVGGKAPEPEEKKSAVPRIETKKKKKITHKVKGPKPVSDGGSAYKTGRKAAKERKAKVDAARKAAAGQPRGGSGAGRNQKNKGKRK